MKGMWYPRSNIHYIYDPRRSRHASGEGFRSGSGTMRDIARHVNTEEVYLFNTGEAQQAYRVFGCHDVPEAGMHRFLVWAPHAKAVSVVGDFNNWHFGTNPMEKLPGGIFVAYVPGLKDGDNYKYHVTGSDGHVQFKSDPFAVHAEVAPKTASKVWSLGGYEWRDGAYLQRRREQNIFTSPMSIYEMHIGSWRTKEGYEYVSLREVAEELADYLVEMHYTHVELLPINEYPFDGSWGYQVTGYFAITSRYGTPQDFMYFVDVMHSHGIGVLVDWVPAHFPKDAHGLAAFDGTCLFEHANPMQANHPQWGTLIFNYKRPEVVSFLVSSAMMLLDVYHVDGIRVDAVTSMLYLNYARNEGEYVPNEHGGNIDLGAEAFLKKLNATVHARHPGVVTVAEESTSFPGVTKPTAEGGLGFTFKWNMGFMHDTLSYMSMDHFFRQFNHNKLTFSLHYAFSEHFVLPYSHDEVVHGKKSLLDKMYGGYDEKFSSLRTLYGFMFAHPGKKLNFMGSEFGQFIEWDPKRPLDWFLLDYPRHVQLQRYVRDLGAFYASHPALFEVEDGWAGFTWLNVEDASRSCLCFMRTGMWPKPQRVACAFNFTPVPVENWVVGMPAKGTLALAFCSDAEEYGGSGMKVKKNISVREGDYGGLPYRAELSIPPLSAVYYVFTEDLKEVRQNGQ